MSIPYPAHPWFRTFVYWLRLGSLEVFGPAQQDPRHDAIELLKEEFGRPNAITSPRRN